MYHKIEELAYNGDVQAIWSMLKDIVDNTWDVQCKTVYMTDPETGEDMVGSSFEAQRTSPRDLSEEESGIVKNYLISFYPVLIPCPMKNCSNQHR